MGSMGSSQGRNKDGKEHPIHRFLRHTAFHTLPPLLLGYVGHSMASYNWWLACLFITDIFFLGDTENNGAPPLTP